MASYQEPGCNIRMSILPYATTPSTAEDALRLFFSRFDFIFASDPAILKQIHQLRYRIFCQEHQIFEASQYAAGVEQDPYDNYSVHCLLRHRASSKNIATVRLVLARSGAPVAKFPVENLVGDLLMYARDFLPGISRHRIAEISRFSVSRTFLETASQVEGANLTKEHCRYIYIALFRAIVKMSAMNGVTHWCAAMEPCLMRLLSRFGICFQPVSDLLDYHGLRYVCVASVEEVLTGIKRRRPDVWSFITD